MQLVTFATDVAPHVAGEKRLVPDAVAEKLLADGDASAAEPYPRTEANHAVASRHALRPQRAAPRDNRKAR